MHKDKAHKLKRELPQEFAYFDEIKGSKICPRMISDTWIDMITIKQKLRICRLGFE